MELFAVLHNSMIYESPDKTISVHKTAKGAYKVFRKLLVEAYNEERERWLLIGGYGTPRRGQKYLWEQWFGIKKIDILE